MVDTLVQQLHEICEMFHRTDLNSDEPRNKLAEKIDVSALPRYHKEVLKVAFLTKRPELVSIGLHVVHQQEILRHQDSLVKIQQKALTERIRKES
jgi:hypothetical protein